MEIERRIIVNKLEGLTKIKVHLSTINTKVTREISFEPSEPVFFFPDAADVKLSCLEDPYQSYTLNPSNHTLMKERNIYAYDESIQDFSSLEGTLSFFSFAIIKLDNFYSYSIEVIPYFFTSMKKFENSEEECIRYSTELQKDRNIVVFRHKSKLILENVQSNSIVLIDGPLLSGNASSMMVNLDRKLREVDCIPVYIVKNSDSRLIIENIPDLATSYNSDFHWATKKLQNNTRTALFQYIDQYNKDNFTKVFCYIKTIDGFAQRVEFHSETYQQYLDKIPALLDLISYFFIAQGNRSNPQLRLIAIAEKYAKAILNSLNIPILLRRMNFRPTVNQVRYG